MSRSTRLTLLGAFCALAVLPAAAQAAIFVDTSPGAGGDPPPALGGYTMVPAPTETREQYEEVEDVALANGVLTFDQPALIFQLNDSWTSDWGSYHGLIYFDNHADDSITMTLPDGTRAFYFYGDVNGVDQFYPATATAQDGTTSGPIPIRGGRETAAAQYFGFYATDGDEIETVTFSVVGEGDGVAVGRFATATTSGGATGPKCFGQTPTIDRSGENGGVTVTGTAGDDIILTGNGADTVDGLGGNDKICTLDGDDTVRGGGGDDQIFGGRGNDRLQGQAGNDRVVGGEGNDDLHGGDGTDEVRGQDGNDTVHGGNGDNDIAYGGSGDDTVLGGAGTGDHCDGDANLALPMGIDRTTANGGCETTANIP